MQCVIDEKDKRIEGLLSQNKLLKEKLKDAEEGLDAVYLSARHESRKEIEILKKKVEVYELQDSKLRNESQHFQSTWARETCEKIITETRQRLSEIEKGEK